MYAFTAVQTTNDLFAGNQASSGSGLYLAGDGGAQATIRHSTVVSPTLGSGSAIHVAGGTADIFNTIVASHTTGIRQTGGTVNEDHTLFFGNGTDVNSTGGTYSPGSNSLHGQDSHFADPATEDYHIDTESAALDAGAFLGVTSDFDGDARPTNTAQPDAPDMGFDENKSLTVRREISDTMTFGAACARLAFTDTGTLSAVTVQVVYDSPGDPPNFVPLPRYYLITPEGSEPYEATLALCYTQDEFNSSAVGDENQLSACRFDGANWNPYASVVESGGNVVTALEVSTFSQWAIGGLKPTAAGLAYFTSRPSDRTILLEWETGMEIDNLGFNLYRAKNSTGQRLRLNENLIPSQNPGSALGAHYEFVDDTIELATTYYYWLEDMDAFGNATLHGPVSASLLARRLIPMRARPVPDLQILDRQQD